MPKDLTRIMDEPKPKKVAIKARVLGEEGSRTVPVDAIQLMWQSFDDSDGQDGALLFEQMRRGSRHFMPCLVRISEDGYAVSRFIRVN